MVEIEVCERLMDCWYEPGNLQRRPKSHASIKGVRGIWSTGRYPDEAIGKLVCDNPDLFNIKISNLGELSR